MTTEKDKLISKAISAIQKFDFKLIEEVSKSWILQNIDSVELIENTFKKVIVNIGIQFEKKKIDLPYLIASSEVMKLGINILKSDLEKKKCINKKIGKAIICTVEGDIHTIGKDIISLILSIVGFDVIDLGRDIPVKEIIIKAIEEKPLLIATSAMMTTTMIHQIQLEKQLIEAGIRNQLQTMVGGAPCTQEWADIIGANIYGENITDVISKIRRLYINKQ